MRFWSRIQDYCSCAVHQNAFANIQKVKTVRFLVPRESYYTYLRILIWMNSSLFFYALLYFMLALHIAWFNNASKQCIVLYQTKHVYRYPTTNHHDMPPIATMYQQWTPPIIIESCCCLMQMTSIANVKRWNLINLKQRYYTLVTDASG